MKIDNSQMQAWQFCPMKWQERYENNLEPRVRDTSSLMFGTRMHQLLEERHKGTPGLFGPLDDEVLEAEAQLTFEAYCAYYPEEPFEIVATEQYFEVPLDHDGTVSDPENGSRHRYNGEFDAVVRRKDSGKLYLLETKTESRTSRSNSPEAWISKSQVGLYQWAAEQIYGEEFEGILLNVITRQSPKGQCAPVFRRDNLHRTKEQQLDAIRNIIWVADQIENMQLTGFVPSNRNNCVSGNGWRCDFWALHVEPEGRPIKELVQLKFKPAERYLNGI